MKGVVAKRTDLVLLASAFLLSAIFQSINVRAGGPQMMIDDFSLMDGGFLVWFGNAPPQHCYLETWVCGITSIGVYVMKYLFSHGFHSVIRLDFLVNLIPHAYRDYYLSPDLYYTAYRVVLIVVNMVTAYFLYRVARLFFEEEGKRFAAILPSVLYLFSYNTYWCVLVGRPDTLVSFVAVTGLYCYLKSIYKVESPYFWGAAALFGAAAGLKLHGAFFAVFICIDLFRTTGWKEGWKRIAIFVPIAVFLFLVADGALLFDPVKYIKARWLTYTDDLSPWIHWGDQFLKMLRGSGWVTIPIILLSPFIIAKGPRKSDQRTRSVILISILWIILFSSIRQLRPYWMLPALPFFYLTFSLVIMQIKQDIFRKIAILGVVALFILQSVILVNDVRSSNMDQLRKWVLANISAEEPFYLFGYEILQLPRNTKCMNDIRTVVENKIRADSAAGLPFTYRHAKNWEEESALKLMDMLNYRSDVGYTYYSSIRYPFEGNIRLEDMKYIIVQQDLLKTIDNTVTNTMRLRFTRIAQATGPGGDGTGLSYLIYKRVR